LFEARVEAELFFQADVAARAEELGRGESIGFLKEIDAINLRR
jgi:hypothetical protein